MGKGVFCFPHEALPPVRFSRGSAAGCSERLIRGSRTVSDIDVDGMTGGADAADDHGQTRIETAPAETPRDSPPREMPRERSPSSSIADGLLEAPDRLIGLFRDLARGEIGIGSAFDGFTLDRKIGEGGMGVVYEATQDSPRRRVAIKLIPARGRSRSSHQRLRFETQLLACLDHPNITKVFAAGCTVDANEQEIPYFAMDLVPEARPLTTYARERRLPLRARVELFALACHAVGYGHTRGVIHRDIKPANVLVGDDGIPKVIDFGIARAISAEFAEFAPTSSCTTWLGTVEYMAPEQFPNPEDASDTRSDVYSLGVTLHELLTGKRPASMRQQHTERSQALELRKLAGIDLARVITKAMSPVPHDRYSSATEFAEDLDRWLQGEPVAARTASIGYLLRHALRRHRWQAFVALALVSLTLLAVALHRSTKETAAASDDARFQLYTRQLATAAFAVNLAGRDQLPALLRDLAVDQPAWEARLLAAFRSGVPCDITWDAPVTALSFAPQERGLLIGDASGRVSLVDPFRPDRRTEITRIGGKVVHFDVGHDSSRILAFSSQGHTTLIDLASLRPVRSWDVAAAAISRDGHRLFLLPPGMLKVIDVDTNVTMDSFALDEDREYHRCFLSQSEDRILALGVRGLAVNVQIETTGSTRELHGFGKILDAAWIGPNNYAFVSVNNGPLRCDDGATNRFDSQLAYGTGELIDSSDDGRVLVLGDPLGRVMTKSFGPDTFERDRQTHLGPVTAICVSATGEWVASAGVNGHVRVAGCGLSNRVTPESRRAQYSYYRGPTVR